MTTNADGSPAGGNPGAAQPPAAAPWYGADAGDDIKGFVELKGWDQPGKAIESYRNLENLLGAEKAGRTVVLPKDDNDAEGLAAFRAKLGVPAKPEEYGLKPPEGQPDDFAKAAAQVLHQLGLTTKQAQGLATWWNEHQGKAAEAAAATAAQAAQTDTAALKQEWGAAFTQNCELVDRAATTLGLAEQEVAALRDALGTGQAMRFLHKIGTMLAEDQMVTGKAAVGEYTPGAAKARLEQVKGDQEFMRKLNAGDSAARAEMDRIDAGMLGMTLADYLAATGRAAA